MDAHGDKPYFLNPLIAAAQIYNVAREGEEPDMWAAQEDCRCGAQPGNALPPSHLI